MPKQETTGVARKRVGYWKGKKLSPEHRQKLSDAKKGRPPNPELLRRMHEASRGRIVSQETREKLRKAFKGKPGTKFTEERKRQAAERQRGSKSHFWKDGRSKQPGYRAMLQRLRKHRLRSAQGNFSVEEWMNLKRLHGFKCVACLRPEGVIKLTIDHIVPISKGGINAASNIQPLCVSCNSSKNTKIINYTDDEERKHNAPAKPSVE